MTLFFLAFYDGQARKINMKEIFYCCGSAALTSLLVKFFYTNLKD